MNVREEEAGETPFLSVRSVRRRTKKKEKRRRQMRLLRDLYDVAEVCCTVTAVLILCTLFLFRITLVEGRSMEDTLHENDAALILLCGFAPKTGDIVVCQSEEMGLSVPLIKRVIATEGQKITLDTKNWTVFVDGVPLDEPYVKRETPLPMRDWEWGDEFVVPEGQVFVMGDNRNNSLDSRSSRVGTIDVRLVYGKVLFHT